MDADELGPAAGVRRARADGIDGDAVLTELVRHRLGDGERAEIDRTAHHLHALRLAPARAGDIDHPALVGFPEVRDGLARHADQAQRLYRVVAFPQLVRHFLEPTAGRTPGA